MTFQPRSDNLMAFYEARLTDLWQRLIRSIGIHTLHVLMERAQFEASHKHPELALIEHNDESLSFTELETAYKDRPEAEIAEAFHDLSTELMLILARLLGKEMAMRLAEELDARIEADPKGGPDRKTG